MTGWEVVLVGRGGGSQVGNESWGLVVGRDLCAKEEGQEMGFGVGRARLERYRYISAVTRTHMFNPTQTTHSPYTSDLCG